MRGPESPCDNAKREKLRTVNPGCSQGAGAPEKELGMRSLANEAKRGILMASPARATDFMVTNTNDSGAGSLREAVGFANANAEADTITFDLPANSVVTLSSQIGFTASQKTTVDGGGGVTVSGGDATRVFQVNSGANVSIERLTVSDGITVADADGGAGIRNNNGALSVVDSTVSGNRALDDGNQPSLGGGIFSQGGALSVVDSTVSGNYADLGKL